MSKADRRSVRIAAQKIFEVGTEGAQPVRHRLSESRAMRRRGLSARLERHMERGEELMELNRAEARRNTDAFERLMATLDRHEKVFDQHEKAFQQHEKAFCAARPRHGAARENPWRAMNGRSGSMRKSWIG